jgi:arylsulfatase A-like enzyme
MPERIASTRSTSASDKLDQVARIDGDAGQDDTRQPALKCRMAAAEFKQTSTTAIDPAISATQLDTDMKLATPIDCSQRQDGNLLHKVAALPGLAMLGMLLQVPCAELIAADENPRPNIIFIMADDLGYGDLGCYGQQRIQTPNIDRLAAEGLRFTDYYAGASVCAPSRCVLMTGLHTGHAFIRGNSKMNLRVGDVTVAEVLKQAGYTNGLFGKWGLGHERSGGLPIVQGFDEFYGFLDQHHAHNYFPSFLIRGRNREKLTNVVPDEGEYGQGVATERNEYAPDLIWAAALQFLDRAKNAPFFMYLAPTLPHANNEAGDAGMEILDYGRYAQEDWPAPQKGLAAMITRLDADVGLLMELLQQYGLDERTIVFFTSDNGPHKEGGNDPEFFDSNGPLRGRKRDLYEGGVRVPLIVRWPGKIAPGTVSNQVAYHGDLMMTLKDLSGAPRVPPELDSISYAPTLLGRPDEQFQHEWLYWEFYEKGFRQAVRFENWKGIRAEKDDATFELYDLSKDVGEEHNVAAGNPEIVAQIAEMMNGSHVTSPDWPRDPKKDRPVPQRPELNRKTDGK